MLMMSPLLAGLLLQAAAQESCFCKVGAAAVEMQHAVAGTLMEAVDAELQGAHYRRPHRLAAVEAA